MTDPLRTDRLLTTEEVPERDRDARIEELLVRGLDHYFAGQHELAISVWTRVLFLDRGHARARAYIDRARSAIAERQREGEELLHTGAAALDRGDAGAARQLLTSAVERGAASDEALALLDRLNRLDVAAPRREVHGVRRPVLPAPSEMIVTPTVAGRTGRLAWVAVGVVTGLALAALTAWLWTHAQAPDLSSSPNPPSAIIRTDDPLPIPAPAEASLTRARNLFERGRLHDAMAALNSVRPGDPLRPQADELRATIQRQLLDAAHAGKAAAPNDGARTPRQ